MTLTEPRLRDDVMEAYRRGANPLDLAVALEDEHIAFLLTDWWENARSDQVPPEGNWLVWLLLGGRGAGKTRAGAEWVRGMALGLLPYAREPTGPIALVGET